MWYAFILVAVLVAVLVAAVVVARRRFVVVRVSGMSMWPTYRPGDRVLVRRAAAREVGRGEVVVFEPAGRTGWRTGPLPAPQAAAWVIKRVTALAGDPVPADVVAAVRAEPGAAVPEGALVVVGDGTSSADSRIWGYLPADRVLGVAVRRLSSGPPSPGPPSPGASSSGAGPRS
ncbi:S26 family signal peptidase [Nonomuraea guangzhouensis]|uniref:S26 family signal peptidase n=1 Tax=Nonomuraea guangzhouensis TaxID=1291555 RepID=A0ABW4GTR5_9ACTN|nr:S26 family signal peptidase [Nonomuraea guangzhouensis]